MEESLSVFGIQELKISGCMLIEDMTHVNGQDGQCILGGFAPLFYALDRRWADVQTTEAAGSGYGVPDQETNVPHPGIDRRGLV